MSDAALKAALDLVAAAALGRAPSGPPFRELWARYFHEEGRENDSAVDIDRRGKLILAFLGDRPALEFTTEQAANYRDLRADPKRSRDLYAAARVDFTGRKPRPATVNREIAVGRRALQWAVEQRLIPYNPLAGWRASKEDNLVTSMIRSESELQKLLSVADAEERAAILLYVDCGPRRMEVLSLLWDQLFVVRHKGADKPIIKLWKTKTDRPRTIGLTMRTYQALQVLPRAGRYVFPGRVPGRYAGRAAPVRPGTHLDPDAFGKRFKRLSAKAGVVGSNGEPLTLHKLRHSFAYLRRVQDGISEREIMGQGGWITRSAFERYGIGDESERAAMYDQVNAGIEAALARLRK